MQFKIFWGNRDIDASQELNKWLKMNPHVEIIDWQHQLCKYTYHTICIRYKERGGSDVQ